MNFSFFFVSWICEFLSPRVVNIALSILAAVESLKTGLREIITSWLFVAG